MRNFHPLEVVYRGSDTQLQVGGNLNVNKDNLEGKGFPFIIIENHPSIKIVHF